MRTRPVASHLLVSLVLTGAAVFTAFALPLPAQAADGINIHIGWGKGVDGSGRSVSVARRIGAFNSLRIDGPIDVVARAGAAPAATVTAEDNIEPAIETVLEGSTLVVRLQKGSNFHTWRPMKVDLTFTELNAADLRGSGDLKVDGLTAPRVTGSITGSGDLRLERAALGSVEVGVAGSGDVWVTGKADDARFSVAGSGDIHAGDLQARRVVVSISGSGDARVNASESLDARVAGSGDIVYSGNPSNVSRKVAGSGSIEPGH